MPFLFRTLLHCTNCVVVLPKGSSYDMSLDMTNQKANSCYLPFSFGWSAKNTDFAYECFLFK